MFYAFQAVLDAGKLTPGDNILLHGMGVRWADNVCRGNCKSAGDPKAIGNSDDAFHPMSL